MSITNPCNMESQFLSRRAFLKSVGALTASFALSIPTTGQGLGNHSMWLTEIDRLTESNLNLIKYVGVHPFNQANRHASWPSIFEQFHLEFLDRAGGFNHAKVLDVQLGSGETNNREAKRLGAWTASYFSQNPDLSFAHLYYDNLPEDQLWEHPDGTIASDPFNSSAARNIFNDLMFTSGRDKRAVMSQCSPYWSRYQKESIDLAIEHGFSAIDIDLVDTVPFSHTKGWDFSGWALQKFRDYLRERYSLSTLAGWGILDIGRFDIREYLLNRWISGAEEKSHGDGEPFFNTDPLDLPLTDPIVREFHKFQYHNHMEYFRDLVQHAHDVGERQDQFVPYFGNLIVGHPPDLLSTANPTVIMGRVMDLVQIETRPSVPPAGRLTSACKLARAMGDFEKPVWSLHNPFYGFADEPDLPPDGPLTTLLQLYVAETYAAGVIPEIDLGGWPGVPDPRGLFLDEGQPIPELAKNIDYVAHNSDLFDGNDALSNVALVYSIPSFLWRDVPLFGIWYGWERAAFAGYARALEDAHIQYDALIFGHSELWDDEKMLDRLSQYSAVILPYVSCISDTQVQALTDYVQNGGKLITAGDFTRWPDRSEDYEQRDMPPLQSLSQNPGQGQIMAVDLEAVRTYFERVLQQGRTDRSNINHLLAPLQDESQFIQVEAPLDVGVNAWRREDRLLLHLVNYDYQVHADAITPTNNIHITIPYAELLGPEPPSVRFFSPDLESAQTLSCSREGGNISCSVPELHIWGTIVIS